MNEDNRWGQTRLRSSPLYLLFFLKSADNPSRLFRGAGYCWAVLGSLHFLVPEVVPFPGLVVAPRPVSICMFFLDEEEVVGGRAAGLWSTGWYFLVLPVAHTRMWISEDKRVQECVVFYMSKFRMLFGGLTILLHRCNIFLMVIRVAVSVVRVEILRLLYRYWLELAGSTLVLSSAAWHPSYKAWSKRGKTKQ